MAISTSSRSSHGMLLSSSPGDEPRGTRCASASAWASSHDINRAPNRDGWSRIPLRARGHDELKKDGTRRCGEGTAGDRRDLEDSAVKLIAPPCMVGAQLASCPLAMMRGHV